MIPQVIVVGARGRMGQVAVRFVRDCSEFELLGGFDNQRDFERALAQHPGALALDFTRAGLGFQHGMALLKSDLRPVIGTSGVSPEEVEELDGLARERGLGGIVVPNFSLGMAALQAAALQIAARHFSEVEIIEAHHPSKLDAPSATALETARQIEACLATSRVREIPIHSLRLSGVQARQEVVFGAAGERLSLAHEVVSRDAYGAGILMALRFACQNVGVAHGLACVFARNV